MNLRKCCHLLSTRFRASACSLLVLRRTGRKWATKLVTTLPHEGLICLMRGKQGTPDLCMEIVIRKHCASKCRDASARYHTLLNFCEYYPLIKVLPNQFWPGAWDHASCHSPLPEASTTPSALLAPSCALSSMGDVGPAHPCPAGEWQGSRGQGRTALPSCDALPEQKNREILFSLAAGSID